MLDEVSLHRQNGRGLCHSRVQAVEWLSLPHLYRRLDRPRSHPQSCSAWFSSQPVFADSAVVVASAVMVVLGIEVKKALKQTHSARRNRNLSAVMSATQAVWMPLLEEKEQQL